MSEVKLVWNVYVSDFNARQIKIHNIFDHYRFLEDVMKLKKITDYSQFCEKLRKDLMYYYWSKSEWEIVLDDLVIHSNFEKLKIDVYEQVMLNKEQFFKYVWNTFHPKNPV